MKLFYILVLSILLTACAVIETQNETEEIIEEITYENLTLELISDKQEVEIFSEIEFNCNVEGGKQPYNYKWIENTIECGGNECTLTPDKLGSYKIDCTVKDDLNNTITKSISFKVIKREKDIEEIYTLGDSLTYGHNIENPKENNWAKLYSNELNAKLFNNAVSGATIYGIIDYQLPLFKKQVSSKTKLIYIWVGSNDAKNFISLTDFRKNYETIVNETKNIENSKLILITMPDASKLQVADDIETSVNDLLSQVGVGIEVKKLGQDIIKQYNDIILSIAKQNGLDTIDMFTYMEEFNNSLVSDDMFHPNEEGHKEIAKLISNETSTFYEYDRLK